MSGPFGSSQWFKSTDYQVNNSVRLEQGDSPYLSRTPSSSASTRKWSFSCWVKRSALDPNDDGHSPLLGISSGNNPTAGIRFQGDFLAYWDYGEGGTNYILNASTKNTAEFRDVNGWYHIFVRVDTTGSTENRRIVGFVNGVEVTWDNANQSGQGNTFPSQNADVAINSHSYAMWVGATSGYGYFDGYMSEVYFINNQVLDADVFGEYDDQYGHWKPKKYGGTFDAHSFYLKFEDSSNLGLDSSGQSNNLTANNLGTRDQSQDSPTNNFATLSHLDFKLGHGGTVNQGGLRFVNDGNDSRRGTLGAISGKYYAEFSPQTTINGSNPINYGLMGLNGKVDHDNMERAAFIYSDNALNKNIHYNEAGSNGNDAVSDLNNIATDDVLQLAWDVDSGKVWVGRNNTWLSSGDPAGDSNPAHTMATTGNNPITIGCDHAGVTYQVIINTGTDSSFNGGITAQGKTDERGIGDFYYTPPAGFLALCTRNIPDPAIVPGDHFNTVLYTGNGSQRNITGFGFQPDFVFLKSRNGVGTPNVFDVVRGATKRLRPDSMNDESTVTDALNAFISDGFSIGNEYGNNNNETYVAWGWKANGSTATNTSGSINSTVSANTAAGFSVVGYAGDGGVDTIGHGLNQAPEMLVIKNRTDDDTNWNVWHHDLSTNENVAWNSTNGESENAQYFFGDGTNMTVPTSSVFTVGNNAQVNAASKNYIAYCWHSVEGHSKIGAYTGNGDADGTFVYTGFRPAFLMQKRINANGQMWMITDSARDPYNAVDDYVQVNSNNAEADYDFFDFTATGFKHRHTSSHANGSGDTYIYMAFAETPAKYANAK